MPLPYHHSTVRGSLDNLEVDPWARLDPWTTAYRWTELVALCLIGIASWRCPRTIGTRNGANPRPCR